MQTPEAELDEQPGHGHRRLRAGRRLSPWSAMPILWPADLDVVGRTSGQPGRAQRKWEFEFRHVHRVRPRIPGATEDHSCARRIAGSYFDTARGVQCSQGRCRAASHSLASNWGTMTIRVAKSAGSRRDRCRVEAVAFWEAIAPAARRAGGHWPGRRLVERDQVHEQAGRSGAVDRQMRA